TEEPTETPEPTEEPTVKPTRTSRPRPTETVKPTEELTKTPEPTEKPTVKPTRTPRPRPTETIRPTEEPTETPEPTEEPTVKPTRTSRPRPTETVKPTEEPTMTETQEPNNQENNEGDGSLSGTVWYDLNTDGHRDPGEPGIPDICVLLVGKRSLRNYTVTDTGGTYRFPSPPGDFDRLEFLVPDGYSCTIPGPDNDAHSPDGIVASAGGGASRQALNAGFTGDYQTGTPAAAYGWVRGTIWSDNNQDGIMDETHGMAGVEILLLDADGTPVASTRTRSHYIYESMYLFGPLPPGEYSLSFTALEDYIFTGTGGGSHADPLTGMSDPFRIEGGDVIIRNAGMIPSPTPPATAQEPDPTGTETPGIPDNDAAGTEENENDGEVVDDDATGGEEATDAGDVNETPVEPGEEDTAGIIDLFNDAPPENLTGEVTEDTEPEVTTTASLLSRWFNL
ncbi:MAG: SdrD B-like domain-containing protein, partial [Methanoculleus sp.]